MYSKQAILSLLACIVLSSCGPQQENSAPETLAEETLRQHEDRDTTLQAINEVSVRAIVGEDMQSVTYDQDTLRVKSGALVKLAFTNESTDPKKIYNLVIIRSGFSAQAAREASRAGASGNYLPDSSLMFVATPIALPGQTVHLEFTAPDQPGVYEFVNTYPNETPLLRGKLIIH